MANIGFSTGAISLGDFRRALLLLNDEIADSVELSALRIEEIWPLIEAIPELDLSRYQHISLHVPSSFSPHEEHGIIDYLQRLPQNWLLVVHPDAIHDFSLWNSLGSRVAIENMDRRKPLGRSANELLACFERMPDARLCFDIGHARQFDPSMAEAYLILRSFTDRLVQVHVSEVNTQSKHAVITYAAELAFREVAHMIPENVPLILESRVKPDQIGPEMKRAQEILRPAGMTA